MTIIGLYGPPIGKDTAGLLSPDGLTVRIWSEFVKSVAMLVTFNCITDAYISRIFPGTEPHPFLPRGQLLYLTAHCTL